MSHIAQKSRILIVDDNPENIWPLIEHLENEYEILTATSGQGALDFVFTEDQPDLILLDIVMPGMDGYEVYTRLKADTFSHDIPIIFLTGKDDEREETRGLELGAQDYITKPFSLNIVQARIKAILDINREIKRRLLLKTNMAEFNNKLEQQVQQKQKELQEAQTTLQVYDDNYLDLFDKQHSLAGDTRKSILVVDDNPDNIHILVETLEAEYDITYATNGQDALDIAFSEDQPDLILLDIMMPGMDGYEVCARLKACGETWEIPIIFVTALNQEVDETRGLQLGAIDFVSKPFKISVVQARIKSVLLLKDAMAKRLQLTCKLENLNQNLEKRIKTRTLELEQAHSDKDELANQLRQAQKMESIGTLAGGIAHDFNNILSAIFGHSELAQLLLPDDSEVRKHITEILQASNRAKKLVRQILTFSRRSEQERTPTQIHLIIKEALKLLRASIPTSIEIVEQLDVINGIVLADPTQIHQIMMNLCTNAYQAMEKQGGTLTVRLERVTVNQDSDTILTTSLAPGSYLCLTIGDTGFGMNQATQERIFDPYFTTKTQGKGTGLGLAVVHGIVKTHGGHITVNSVQEQGTTFQVYLPEMEESVIAEKQQETTTLPRGTERILVVDDEAILVEIHREILSELGYQVTGAVNSEEALRLFEAHPARYDLLLTDQIMPHMSGQELARKCLDLQPDLPIVICSGCNDMANKEQKIPLGRCEYISKPMNMERLAIVVRKILDQP